MSVCWNCGEEIEFRHVEGQVRPIHLSGGWCSVGDHSIRKSQFEIRELKSYINPNAMCPECGDSVFFYQNSSGSRVFFDALGWPWPKHPCTDTDKAKRRHVTPLYSKVSQISLKNHLGEDLAVYEIDQLNEVEKMVNIRFVQIGTNKGFWASIEKEVLKADKIKVADFREAPSFVLKRKNDLDGFRLVEFISARKKSIISIKMHTRKK
jgi:hypothetical protein